MAKRLLVFLMLGSVTSHGDHSDAGHHQCGSEILFANGTVDFRRAAPCTALLLDETGIRGDKLIPIAEAFNSMSELRVVSLHGNRIGDKGAAILAKGLENKRSALSELYLDNNIIGNVGFAQLGAALSKNSALKVLDLDYNPANDDGLASIVTSPSYASRKC